MARRFVGIVSHNGNTQLTYIADAVGVEGEHEAYQWCLRQCAVMVFPGVTFEVSEETRREA